MIEKIKEKLSLIESRLNSGMDCDSIECDSLLGELAGLVQDAREAIDNAWRISRQKRKLDLSELDLGDLGL